MSKRGKNRQSNLDDEFLADLLQAGAALFRFIGDKAVKVNDEDDVVKNLVAKVRNEDKEEKSSFAEHDPYNGSKAMSWPQSENEQRIMFYSSLEDGFLISRFMGALYVVVAPDPECDCGNHYGVTVLFPPDIHPMTAQIHKDELFERVIAMFNINHFRYVSTEKLNDDIEHFTTNASLKQKLDSIDYMNKNMKFSRADIPDVPESEL